MERIRFVHHHTRPLVVGWDSPGSRGCPGHNRIISCDNYRQGPTDMPFKLLFCGECYWQAGNYWERERCSFFGVELICEGDLRFIQNQREYVLSAGDIMFLQPGAVHCYHTGPSGFCRRLFVGIAGTLIEPFLIRSGLDGYDMVRAPEPDQLAERLQRFERLVRSSAPYDPQRLSVDVYDFLLYIAGFIWSSYPPPILSALAFIRQRLDRTLSSREIARAAGVSVPHLARLFRQALHTSPVRYHERERMARAQVLLRYSAQSVKQIAGALGYDDALYFSKRFRKHTGLSPRQYRQAGLAALTGTGEDAR